MIVKTPVHTSELLVQFFIPQAKRMRWGADKHGEISWQLMKQKELAGLLLSDALDLFHAAEENALYSITPERAQELCLDIANRAAMVWGQLNHLHRPQDQQESNESVKEAT